MSPDLLTDYVQLIETMKTELNKAENENRWRVRRFLLSRIDFYERDLAFLRRINREEHYPKN
jgi:hypothetical protein